jgi:beta-lactamase regulating signal transducer with metallopeptidase domain
MKISLFTELAGWVWDASWHAAIVVAVVLLFRRIAGKHIPASWRCAIWSLVAIRLLIFVAPQSSWSLFSVFDHSGWAQTIEDRSTPPPISQSSHSQITVGYGPAPLAAGAPILQGADGIVPGAAIAPIALFALVWITGVIALAVRTAFSRRQFIRQLNRDAPLSDPQIIALLDQCRALMRISRRVEVIATSAVTGPALFGVVRPRILVPHNLCARLDHEQLRFVFLHELAHLRCHDVLAEWFITSLTTLHWFNPAVWLAAHLHRADRELSRDAMVLAAVGRQQRLQYGNTLLHLLQLPGSAEASRRLTVAMLGEKHHLKQRISMIANLRKTPARLTLLALAVVCCLIAVFVLTNPRRVATSLPTTTPASDLLNLSTITYDVHDLIVPSHDYDSDPDHPVGSNGLSTRPMESAVNPAQPTGQLVTLIRETVDPQSWARQNSGAAIVERDDLLIITQNSRNHRAVAQVLDQLRQTRAFQIATALHFVVFDPATLPEDHPAFAPVVELAKVSPQQMPTHLTLLTPDQTTAILNFAATQEGVIRAAPALNTRNGQRAFIKVATSRAFVGDIKVIRDAQGNFKSYEPIIETADSGLTIDLQATVSADRKFITMSIRPLLTKLLKLHTIPFAKLPADHPAGVAKPTIQQPEMLTTKAETTASIPDGQTLVMSCGTDCGLLAADDYVPKPGELLFMLVTPHITRTPAIQQPR